MKLAPEFAPWLEQLQRFPEELALGIAPLLRQLWAAVGSEGAYIDGAGVPDGIAGIASRGRYEQMLTSQWLLASEVPMEFLRRAAMQELLFLQPATRERASSRRCVLVLDAGPSQLGSPRLAHLAMLLVLERRARAARSQLEWATVQEPNNLRSECEQADMEALLDSRSEREPTEADVQILLQRLGQLARTDELVWMGGERMCQLVAQVGGQRIVIKDRLTLENDELTVQVQSKRRAREFALKLPCPAVRTMLMRRPFEVSTHRQFCLPIGPEMGDLRFSADGRRVLVRDGNSVSAHLPVFTPNHRPKTVTARPGVSMVGFGWHKKAVMVLGHEDGEIILNWAGGGPARLVTDRQFALPEVGAASCRVFALARKLPRFFICDATGTLFVGKQQTSATMELKAILENILDLRFRNGLAAYVRAAKAGVVEHGTINAELELGWRQTIACKEPPVVVSGLDRVTQIGAVAVQIERNIAAEGGQAGGPGGVWEVSSVGYTGQRIVLDELDDAVACIPRNAVDVGSSKTLPAPGTAWAMLVHSLEDDSLYAVADGFRKRLCHIPVPESPLQWDEHASRVMYRGQNGRVQLVDVGGRRASFSIEPKEGARS